MKFIFLENSCLGMLCWSRVEGIEDDGVSDISTDERKVLK